MSAIELPSGARLLIVPVDALRPNPWNPNKQSARVNEAVGESIDEYGFLEPPLCRPHPTEDGAFEILNGEHRWRKAVEKQIATIPIIVVEGLSEAQAKKLTVILNETTGEPDVALLGRLLADIRTDMTDDEFRLGLPYSEPELKALTEIGDVDWDAFSAGLGDPDPPPLEAHTVTLAFAKQADMERFHTLARVVQHETEQPDEPTAVLHGLTIACRAIEEASSGDD